MNYPDSEFVVANTLAKWNTGKLEPNEIDFSQGFSPKVVSRSFLYLTLPAIASSNFYHLLITSANSLDPDKKNVGPDLDPNCLTPWWYCKKTFKELNMAQ